MHNFAYEAPIQFLLFVFTFFGAVLIAGLTGSYHIFKVSTENPIEALRYE